jgi:hypothetical protein
MLWACLLGVCPHLEAFSTTCKTGHLIMPQLLCAPYIFNWVNFSFLFSSSFIQMHNKINTKLYMKRYLCDTSNHTAQCTPHPQQQSSLVSTKFDSEISWTWGLRVAPVRPRLNSEVLSDHKHLGAHNSTTCQVLWTGGPHVNLISCEILFKIHRITCRVGRWMPAWEWLIQKLFTAILI